MIQAAALSIVGVTVGLSLGRPRVGRFHIDHAAAGVIGAVLTIVCGIAPPGVLGIAFNLLAAPIATLVSLMIITQVAERAGLFKLLAAALAKRAQGDGRKLFAYIFFTGTVVGTVFTNDAVVLIFMPLVFGLVECVGRGTWKFETKLPFYFAVLYIANVVGGLVIANPINLVVANLLGIGFIEFACWMAAPSIASILISYAGIRFWFRNQIPERFESVAKQAETEVFSKAQFACAVIVATTLIGFFTESATGIPIWMVAVTGAAMSLAVQRFLCSSELAPVVRAVGWDVVIFMIGMFVVGLGMRNVGATQLIGSWITQISGGGLTAMRMCIGVFAGICSAVVNNHPTADLMAFTIQDFDLSLAEKKTLAFAALIGGDLGPKMLPIGSLAALIWFKQLRDRGVNVPYSLYIRIGIPITLIAMAASLLVLELQCLLFSSFYSNAN